MYCSRHAVMSLDSSDCTISGNSCFQSIVTKHSQIYSDIRCLNRTELVVLSSGSLALIIKFYHYFALGFINVYHSLLIRGLEL